MTTPLDNNRLIQTFAALRSAGKKTLLPFITAGYPDLDTTLDLLKDFASRGVRVCELGVPFSDPVADGPVIQASYTEALNRGVTTAGIFDVVRRFRAWESTNRPSTIDNRQLSLLTMVSYSIVFRRGVRAYMEQAAAAGVDGLIIPDLPLGEAADVESLAAEMGHGFLTVTMRAAPATKAARAQPVDVPVVARGG